MIAISHVHWTTGAVMPLAEIAEFARERGILTIIDGAQGGGQVRSTSVRLASMPIARPAKSGSAVRIVPDSCCCGKTAWATSAPATCDTAPSTPPGTSLRLPGAARFEMGETYGPAIAAFDRGLLCCGMTLVSTGWSRAMSTG